MQTATQTAVPSPPRQPRRPGRSLKRPTLRLWEVPGITLLRLHSLEDPATLVSRLRADAISLPQETNEVAGDDPAAICTRPGEWLLLSEQASPESLRAQVMEQIDRALTTVLDLSDGIRVFRLSGEAAPWLLAKFSGLDFLAGVSQGPHAAQTRIADLAAVVHYRPADDGSPQFDLLFDRSLARYLWQLLTDAAAHAEELLATQGAVR